MAVEKFNNQFAPVATLQSAIGAGDTTCTVSSADNFSNLDEGEQFRMTLRDTPKSTAELVLVTERNGVVFTIVRGIEGSTAGAHAAGATIAQVITQYHLQNCFPQPPRMVTASGPVTIAADDKIVEIDQTTPTACAVTVDPAALIPGKIYTLKDGGFNAQSFNITLTPTSGDIDGESSFVLSEDGDSIDFYSNGTNLRIK